jgi:hypothetical protein
VWCTLYGGANAFFQHSKANGNELSAIMTNFGSSLVQSRTLTSTFGDSRKRVERNVDKEELKLSRIRCVFVRNEEADMLVTCHATYHPLACF